MSVPRLLSSSTASDWNAAQEHQAQATGEAVRSVEDRVSRYFRDMNDSVFRYLVFTCRNVGDAEEIVQETFLRLYRELAQRESIGNVRHWVFRVARNLMFDRARRRQRTANKLCEITEEVEDRVRCPYPTPEERMIELSEQARLRIAFAALTPLQRECVHLRSQGLRLREIGEILQMDVRRVAEAIQRAVLKLQRAMDA